MCVKVKHEFVSVQSDSSQVSHPNIKLISTNAIRKAKHTSAIPPPIISRVLTIGITPN
jgi:hypothetical protein